MIDLRQQDRQRIEALAEKIFPGGTEIWAYGSRVKGTHHEASDLDLAIHFPEAQSEAENTSQRVDFMEALQDSNIPILVQVMDWKSLPEHFKVTIREAY